MLQAVHSSRQGWQAEMNILLERRGEKTVMAGLTHKGPLRVQRPFYPEGDTSHIYLLHPPGGVVGGDGLNIHIQCKNQSHGLITTPGATKFYLSAGATANVDQVVDIGAGCALEWFPQEGIFFTGAKVKARTCINLESNAHFMGWEISCFGRPVNRERFLHGHVHSRFLIRRDGRPLLSDHLQVSDPAHLSAAAGLRDYPMQGLFVATGGTETLLEECRDVLADAQARLAEPLPAGITLLDDLIVLRILGVHTEKMQSLMIPVWHLLRQKILNKSADIPRIWNT